MPKKQPAELDESLCYASRDIRRFFRSSVIQNEMTGELVRCEPSSTQRPVLNLLHSTNDWLYVGKPRQAHISMLSMLWMLQQSEYYPGRNSLLIANKSDTSDELFDRLLTAHRYQPDCVRVPMSKGGTRGGQFVHRGKLKVASAGGEDPTVGFSVDSLVGTEINLWPNAGPVLSKLIPVVAKRPNSRVVFEGTPGTYGSPQHKLWLSSLAGSTRFRTVFIPWWDHLGYTRVCPTDFKPDNEELRLLEKYVGMTHGHLQFRREMLDTACSGDPRLFANQYPNDELDGWTTTRVPALPAEPLKALIEDSVETEGTWADPVHGHRYMLVCDPANFGETGDPSCWTLWNLNERMEVGCWSGRIDPMKLADQLALLGKRYNDALIVVESNAAACITALLKGGYPRVWQDSGDAQSRPGWWATKVRVERSVGALSRQLTNGQMRVRSRRGLLQLLAFDGDTKRRVGGHHFDIVTAYRIAADLLELLKVAPLREPVSFRNADGTFKLSVLMKRKNAGSGVLFGGGQTGGTL